jgi:WD40 repeat protein
VAYSADGSRVASGCLDGTIKFWDSASGEELASLKAFPGPVHCLAFSRDQLMLTAGSVATDQSGGVKLWRVENARSPLRLPIK